MTSTDIIAASSLFVAALALGATTWQAWTTRRHSRLSVRPLLSITVDASHEQDSVIVKYEIVNVGLGPAIIGNSCFRFGGQTFDADRPFTEQMNTAMAGTWINAFEYNMQRISLGAHSGLVVRPDEKFIVLQFRVPGAGMSELLRLRELTEQLTFHCKYSSLYGEQIELASSQNKVREARGEA